MGWKILQETQQDDLFFFLHVQAQAVFDVATFDFVIVEEIEGERQGGTLIKDQMMMGKPERIIELLVMFILVAMLQSITQRLADLNFLGEAQRGGCPTGIQPGGGSDQVPRWCRGKCQIEGQLHRSHLIESKSAFLERDPALSADHQMIEYGDVKQLPCLHHRTRHSHVIG